MGNPTVDYFSLDVEGAELSILKTIPFDQVNITTFTIEANHADRGEIIEFMTDKGYRVHKYFETVDIMFVKE